MKAILRHHQQLVSRHQLCFGRTAHRSQILLDLAHDLSNLERATLDLRESDGVNQIACANHRAELSEIHLRHNHGLETCEHFTKILRERVEILEMRARNGLAFALQSLDGGSD